MAVQIQLRRDTAANWTSNDPTLANGEVGYETDTNQFKIGDGVTAWSGLSYFASGGIDTSGTPIANDFARFVDADTIEGRSYAEVKADLNLEIGTDVLAQQDIGIADDNLVEMDDADAADDDYARFTANGLEGRSPAEVRSDLNVADGADVTSANTCDTPGGAGTDTTAIHDNVAAEISGVTEKVTPVSADLILIEDSADSNTKKRVQVGNLPGGSGSASKIEAGNSSVEVVDTGTGQVDFEVDGADRMMLNASGLALATGSRVNEIATTVADPGDDTTLVTEQGIRELAALSRVMVRKTSSQSIPTSTYTTLIFDAEDEDSESWYSTGTGILTPTRAVKLAISAQVACTSMVSGNSVIIRLIKNGSTVVATSLQAKNAGGTLPAGFPPIEVDFNGTTDNIRIHIYQNSGSNKNVEYSNNYCFLRAVEVIE